MAILATLPADKSVAVFWDGGPRGDVEGIVNAADEVVIVGEWSIYRDSEYRRYPDDQIVYG